MITERTQEKHEADQHTLVGPFSLGANGSIHLKKPEYTAECQSRITQAKWLRNSLKEKGKNPIIL